MEVFASRIFSMISFPKRNSRSGFTLVELLVVMGIIAILAAVLFPALSMAMSHARTARCSGNLRSISAAMITFAGDNNGNLPESGGTIYHSGGPNSPVIDAITGKSSWTEQLEPYLGPSSFNGTTPNVNPIFQCPDWSNLASLSGGKVSSSANSCKYYSYFNGSHAAGAGNSSYGAVNLLRITAPSAHIIGGDIAFKGYQMLDADPDDYGSNNPAFGDGTQPILLHGGSVNLIFADGHEENVKSYDPTRMTTHYSGIQPTEAYTDYP